MQTSPPIETALRPRGGIGTHLGVTLVTTVLALALYATVIAWWRPVVRLYPDQDAFNLARAERALIAEGRPQTVIAGSSLGVRVPDDWLPETWLNLSLGGKSGATGLALLAMAPAVPKRVLLEVNTLELPADDAFVGVAQGPLPLPLRRLLPGLRSEYRPINLLLSVAGDWSGGPNRPRSAGPLDQACERLATDPARDAVSAEIVAREVARVLPLTAPAELERSLTALRPAVAALQAKGVEVVLFEWPTEPALLQAARASAIRERTVAAFPGLRFVRIDGTGLATEDGLHLAPLSARRAACALARAVGP
jgi:hypothetical protein